MKQSLKMVLVLAIVGLVSGASLALVYKYALPRIEDNQKKELEQAIFKVFPDGTRYEILDEKEEIYRVYDKNILLGYAFTAEGNGYQGNIKLMTGLKKDLMTLTGMEILESTETPGLGGEIAGEDFRKQFINLKTSPKIICVKEKTTGEYKVQAITAATISSKSVVNIINTKIEKVKAIVNK